MATRKKTELTEQEEPIQEEAVQAEEPVQEAAENAELAKARAEIEALKKQLAERQPAKRPAGNETDYDRVHRIEQETAEAGKDPWTVEIDVLVPHREKTEDPWYWINVNGLSVQIPANDRYQTMKLPWACVLVDLLKYEKASLDYQDSLEVFDPETNPHR